MSSQSPLPPPVMPPRPACRPAPPRAATFCFWAVLLLWVTAFGFLWLLASGRNSGQWQPSSSTDGGRALALLLAGFAIAAVIAAVTMQKGRSH